MTSLRSTQLLTHQTFGANLVSGNCGSHPIVIRHHKEAVNRVLTLVHKKIDEIQQLLDTIEDETQDLYIDALHHYDGACK